MPAEQRSLSDILQDAVRNIQEIVRSEVRLAKTELREEFAKAKSSTLLLAGGAVITIFAVLMLLFSAVHALALVMPTWAAALVVGAVLAVIATVMLTTGRNRFKKFAPPPNAQLNL